MMSLSKKKNIELVRRCILYLSIYLDRFGNTKNTKRRYCGKLIRFIIYPISELYNTFNQARIQRQQEIQDRGRESKGPL